MTPLRIFLVIPLVCCALPALLTNRSGYYAIGAHVTLVAILRDSVIDLVSADLSWTSQRLTNLIRIIRLCSVITSLRDVIGARHMTELVSFTRL